MPPAGGNRADAGPVAARPLSPEDLGILALENETVAGHACKVIVLREEPDLDRLRSSIAGRLHQAPGLCMRLSEIDGDPWWVPDPQLDVRAHVVEAGPAGPLDEAGFRAAVAGIFEQHLDRSRPLWRIDVLPRLSGGGSALIWRIHHALADGTTAMRMAREVMWDAEPAADQPAGSGTRPQPPRPAAPVARDRFAGLRAVAREIPQPWLRSPFDGHIDARRAVAFSTAGLDELRQVAAAADGATVNDAVLTVVAGGLRRWLETHHGHLGALRVKVPVSLHGSPPRPGDDAAGRGNRDSFFCLDLPLGSADPLERLAAVRDATRIRKRDHDAQHLDAITRQLARIPPLSQLAARALAHPRSFALNVSDVPGPRHPVGVLGIPVSALYSLAEIREDHALRVAVISMAGTLSFGLVADPTLLPEVHQLAGYLQAEAEALTARLPSA